MGILYRNHKDGDVIIGLKKRIEKDLRSVSFHTYHGAKGLEFDDVYLIHVNEGLTPSLAKESSLEEERRMFYVAVTRAKQRLFVCCVKNKGGKICHPSRFINEMQEK